MSQLCTGGGWTAGLNHAVDETSMADYRDEACCLLSVVIILRLIAHQFNGTFVIILQREQTCQQQKNLQCVIVNSCLSLASTVIFKNVIF